MTKEVSKEEKAYNASIDRMCSWCGAFADVVIHHVKLCSKCYQKYLKSEEIKMAKVKSLKNKTKGKRKAGITIKNVISKVKEKLNEEKIERISKVMKEKYKELEQAKLVKDKIEKQIAELEEKDINEIDVDALEEKFIN